jgi:hypothetical protein
MAIAPPGWPESVSGERVDGRNKVFQLLTYQIHRRKKYLAARTVKI